MRALSKVLSRRENKSNHKSYADNHSLSNGRDEMRENRNEYATNSRKSLSLYGIATRRDLAHLAYGIKLPSDRYDTEENETTIPVPSTMFCTFCANKRSWKWLFRGWFEVWNPQSRNSSAWHTAPALFMSQQAAWMTFSCIQSSSAVIGFDFSKGWFPLFVVEEETNLAAWMGWDVAPSLKTTRD